MTVLESSAAVDLLLDGRDADRVTEQINHEGVLVAPDVLVLEVLATLRRLVLRGTVAPNRAAMAVRDLGDLSVRLFGSLPLCERAWELRGSLAAADALFVALAEQLGEPLMTKDARLARELSSRGAPEVILLGA